MVIGWLSNQSCGEWHRKLGFVNGYQRHELILPPLPWTEACKRDRNCKATSRDGYWSLPLRAELPQGIVFHNDSLAPNSDTLVDKSKAGVDLERTNGRDIAEAPDSNDGYWCKWIIIVFVAVTLLLPASARVPLLGYVSSLSLDTMSLRASRTPNHLLGDIRSWICTGHRSDTIVCKVVLDTDGLRL